MKRKILSYVLVFVFAFILNVPTIPKATYAALALPQCQDGLDNDGDGVIDNTDPQCHTDGDLLNVFSYDANIDNEASPLGGGGLKLPQCQDGLDNDGDGVIDNTDPQCHTDGDVTNPFSYDANIDNEASPLTTGGLTGTVISGGGGGGGGGVTTSGSIPTLSTTPPIGQVLGATTENVVPGLPKTGFPPEKRNTMLPIILLASLSLFSTLLYFAQRKKTT